MLQTRPERSLAAAHMAGMSERGLGKHRFWRYHVTGLLGVSMMFDPRSEGETKPFEK